LKENDTKQKINLSDLLTLDQASHFNTKDLSYKIVVNNETKDILKTSVEVTFNNFMDLAEALQLFDSSLVFLLLDARTISTFSTDLYIEASQAVFRMAGRRLERELKHCTNDFPVAEINKRSKKFL
jgi:hypothetical protein